ncbi:MAG: methyltransferase family protein [Vicinamibacteria bacterium]
MTTQRPSTSGNPLHLLLHIPVPWVFVLTYLAGVAMEVAWPPGMGRTVAGLGVAGGTLFLIGAIVAGWSLVIFHGERTTTVPGRASSKLVTWGPYGFSRNPMYVGLVLAYVGEAGILKQVWPLVLLPLTVAYLNWIVIPLEEARLAGVFREEYEEYRSRVRRWI